MDEIVFRREAEQALESLKQALIRAEEDGGFEVEEKNGVLNVLFEDAQDRFVFSPNAPVRQVWISAQQTSFKLEFDESRKEFVLPRTGETLRALTQRLLQEQLNDASISLT